MKKILLLSLIAVVMYGCQGDRTDSPPYVFKNGVEIHLLDSDGNDMLSPDNPNKLNTDAIKVYFKVNGEYKLAEYVTTAVDRYRYGFSISTNYEDYVLALPAGAYTDENRYAATIIRWNETLSDTISCRVKTIEYETFLEYVNLNGKVVGEYGTDYEVYSPVITITHDFKIKP